MCGYCDIVNMDAEMTPPSPFDENDFNRLSNEVWTGLITTSNLPESIYLKTAQYLNEGIDNGVIGFEIPDELLIADLKENIYVFSGAKTYQQVRAMTAMLAEKEYASNFFAFKEAVKPMFGTYNVDWLQAEYQTSKASARMAAEWNRINVDKDVLGLLQYQTVGDSRVRPTHQILDNIVKPVDDKFWDIYYPPNGWRCRCTVMQQSEGEVSDLKGWIPPDDVPPLFQMNAGKDRIVFKEKGKNKHPYFDVAKGDKENAKNNWGMPIPAKPKLMPKLPNPFKPIEILKNWEVELDDRMFDMLEAPITLSETKKSSHAIPNLNEVYINKKERYLKSKRYQKSIFYHEIGHVIHYQKGIIKPELLVNNDYSDHFSKLKKLVKNNGETLEKKINSIFLDASKIKDENEKLAYLKKYNCENIEDLNNLCLATSDSLMALTNSKFGYGHSKAYMSKKAMKEAEMFAHSMENFFAKNEVFEEVMPDVYNESKKYIQSLLK